MLEFDDLMVDTLPGILVLHSAAWNKYTEQRHTSPITLHIQKPPLIMNAIATHYAFSILITGTNHRNECTHIFCSEREQLSHFSSACCILLIHNWNKTQTKYSKAHFIFLWVLSQVLKTAYLQTKTSFTHTVNCALLNVRFKGQTTSLRLYKEGCRKNCCASEESCYLHNSVPAGSLQLVRPYELINIKEVDLINERVYFP